MANHFYKLNLFKAKKILSPFEYSLFKHHITPQNNIILLGAGASYGITPLWSSIVKRMKEFIEYEWAIDIADAKKIDFEGVKRFLIEEAFRQENFPPSVNHLIGKIGSVPREVLQLLYKCLLLEGLKNYCTNNFFNPYNLLAASHHSSFFINYNQDGLFFLSTNIHKVIEPHGSLLQDLPAVFKLIAARSIVDKDIAQYELNEIALQISNLQKKIFNILSQGFIKIGKEEGMGSSSVEKRLEFVAELIKKRKIEDEDIGRIVDFHSSTLLNSEFILPGDLESNPAAIRGLINTPFFWKFLWYKKYFRRLKNGETRINENLLEYFRYLERKIYHYLGREVYINFFSHLFNDDRFENWIRIRFCIEKCLSVKVIGFSFSEYDQTILEIMKRLSESKNITIFDPNAQSIVEKISNFLKKKNISGFNLNWFEISQGVIKKNVLEQVFRENQKRTGGR